MPSSEFDETDARLLNLIQREFPLEPRPFDAIATRLDIAPAQVKQRILRLKSDRVIRQISAIFDSGALGYSGALVAFKVAPEKMGRVAELVCSDAEISHCYSRDADYNLWFTITVGPEQDLRREIDALALTQGGVSYLVLPTLRVFKIGVFLDVGGAGRDRDRPLRGMPIERSGRPPSRPLDHEDRAAVRALQTDLPIVDAPFAELAAGAGMTENELLSRAADFLKTGVMRRFAAVLWHQRAGYRANAMVCWRVKSDEIEAAGVALAKHPAVSHCYERPTSADWPYPVYTMIHCRDDRELQRTIAELASRSGLSDFRVLRTVKEYKKSRVAYFE